MLRIAIQSKGRLNEDSMKLLAEAGIKVGTSKRTLLTAAKNFPIEILFLRDDDIPETVADGVADIGIVGLNELKEKNANVNIVRPLGFGGCRLSLAIPKEITYDNPSWFNNKRLQPPTLIFCKTICRSKTFRRKFTLSQDPLKFLPASDWLMPSLIS